MKPIYKSLALAAMTLQVSLTLNAETRDDENASTIALQAELLDSLRVELVAQNVSGARNLIESGECVINGSNLVIALDTGEWTRGAMYRVQVLATFGTQTQVIYALNVTVPYYIALSDVPQEFEDNVTIVSTITDVTEADLEGLALEETSQEIKAAITPISAAAEAYNIGKVQLAQAITSKGVETYPTETYPEMAEKVNSISQETYEIQGGELYGAQISGSLQTPNYWDLYAVLMQLLSDGRLINYGGILLAEYYRGYDSLALSGAGAGGAYVVSDKDENGNFIKYDTDIVHTWNTEFDGKGNRWVAYCFADEYHVFQITDTNTSPRSIFIGRKVGTITSLVNGRASQIVVPDGNELADIDSGTYEQNYGKDVVLRNIKHINSTNLVYDAVNTESLYVESDEISSTVVFFSSNNNLKNVIIKANEINCERVFKCYNSDINLNILCIVANNLGFANLNHSRRYGLKINELHAIYKTGMFNICAYYPSDGGNQQIKRAYFPIVNNSTISYYLANTITPVAEYVYIGYSNENKTEYVKFRNDDDTYDRADFYGFRSVTDCELKANYCRNLDLQFFISLIEENMYAHILQRLKQDEPDCGDGVTITLGATNLAKLTSEESMQLLDDLTNIYGYTFA